MSNVTFTPPATGTPPPAAQISNQDVVVPPSGKSSSVTIDGKMFTTSTSSANLLGSLQTDLTLEYPEGVTPEQFQTSIDGLITNLTGTGDSVDDPDVYDYYGGGGDQDTVNNNNNNNNNTGGGDSGDKLTMTDIEDMLAGLAINIANSLPAQTNALISSITAMTAAGVAAGEATEQAGMATFTAAVASFTTSLVFTAVTVGVTASALSSGDDAAEDEALTHTDAATYQSDHATMATQKAVSSGNQEDIIAARQANSKAAESNGNINGRSVAKQQNDETIHHNNQALESQQKVNDLNKKIANTADPTEVTTLTTKRDTEQKSANNSLDKAKESQDKANDLINSKAAIKTSQEATHAREKYNNDPTDEHHHEAVAANERAAHACAKLSRNSPIKDDLHNANMTNSKAVEEQRTFSSKTPPTETDKEVHAESISALSKTAKGSQENAVRNAPKNVYLKKTFSSQGMQVMQNAMQKNMVFQSLSESTANMVNAAFQIQVADDQGQSTIDQANSSAMNEGVTLSNQNLTGDSSLISDLRSSSASVAGDMSSMVQMVKGA